MLITFFITFSFVFNAVFLLFNAYVDGYYVGILFCLFIPLFFAFGIFFWHSEDTTKKGRSMLKLGVILVIVSLILVYAWTIYYFNNLYPYKDIESGMGDQDDPENYHKSSKKFYIIEQVIIGITLVGLYIYFWFACDEWEEIGDDE